MRDRTVTCTATSLALYSRTAPHPHLLVPGPHATFAITHVVRRSTPSFNRALSMSCPVPAPSDAPSYPHHLNAAGAPIASPPCPLRLAYPITMPS